MKIFRKIVNKIHVHNFKKIKKSNLVIVSKIKIKNSKINCVGKNNKIEVEDNTFLDGVYFDIHGDNNIIKIGKNTTIHNSYISIFENGNALEIGDECCVNNNGEFWLTGGTSIGIGNDCLVAANTTIRTSDIHIIMNGNNEIINTPKNVIINNHCWICRDAKILKGVELGENCVIATGSIVSKSMPANSLCGGVPAKILKLGITWKR